MIDLAHCADFALGPVAVRPSTRELAGATGAVTVEPKVMQILVALARADGRVVSRDDLVTLCWRGRVVGDDAINRIIAKLRRVVAAIAPAVRIETIARTGYRLVAVPAAGAVPVAAVPAEATTPAAPPSTAVAAPTVATGVNVLRPRFLIPLGGVAAVVVALAVAAAWHRPPPRATPMPQAVTDLETRGLAAMFEGTPEQTTEAITYLRQATALAPRAAGVWGSLAMGYVLDLGWTPAAERAAVVTRVRDAAAHGLALDPHETRSSAALVSLVPTAGHWPAKAATLAATFRRTGPDTGPLAYQRIQFLTATGHTRAALAEVDRVVVASPLVPWIQASRINLLAAAGRLDDADRATDRAFAIWPHSRLIWFTRFDLAAFNGQPQRALAMAADRDGWPRQTTAGEIERAAQVAQVMATRDPAATAIVLAALAVVMPGQADAERLMRAAAALGRPDIALAAARRLLTGHLPAQPRATMLPLIGLPGDDDPPTAALFVPPATALWADPGFMPLMTSIGLTAYWRRAGAPDLCATPAAAVACRAAGLSAAAVAAPAVRRQ